MVNSKAQKQVIINLIKGICTIVRIILVLFYGTYNPDYIRGRVDTARIRRDTVLYWTRPNPDYINRFQYYSDYRAYSLREIYYGRFRAVLFTTSHHHDRRRPPTADGECSRPRPRTSTGPPREKVCHPGSPCPPRSHPRSCKSRQTAASSHSQILAFLQGGAENKISDTIREVGR